MTDIITPKRKMWNAFVDVTGSTGMHDPECRSWKGLEIRLSAETTRMQDSDKWMEVVSPPRNPSIPVRDKNGVAEAISTGLEMIKELADKAGAGIIVDPYSGDDIGMSKADLRKIFKGAGFSGSGPGGAMFYDGSKAEVKAPVLSIVTP